MKLSVKRSRLDVRKFFFSQRVVSHWNSLPEQLSRDRTIYERFQEPARRALDRYGQVMLCFSAHQSTSNR